MTLSRTGQELPTPSVVLPQSVSRRDVEDDLQDGESKIRPTHVGEPSQVDAIRRVRHCCGHEHVGVL